MKQSIICLSLLSVIFLTSCSKENNNVFDFRLQSVLELPIGLNTIETHYFILRDIPTFYAANLQARGLSSDNVKIVNASRGIFSPRFNGSDLNFIRAVTVSAISKKPPYNKIEMFYQEDVPFNQKEELKMLTSLGDLKNLMAEEKIDLEIRLTFRAYPPPGLSLQLDFGYLVQI